MGDIEPTIEIEAGGFDQVAQDHLRHLPGTTERDVEIWREGVESERLMLWALHYAGERVGTLVWCVEVEPDGAGAIVVQALFCRAIRGVDVFAWTNQKMADLARITGINSLRFWTVRDGLARKAERAGYSRRFVMERAVNG